MASAITLCSLWTCSLVLCCYVNAAGTHGKAHEPENRSSKPPFRKEKHVDNNDPDGSRLSILLVTFAFPGHLIPMAALGEELARRGHNVTLYSNMMEGSDLPEQAAKRSGIAYWNAGPDVMTLAEYDESAREWTNCSVTMQAVKLGSQIHEHCCKHGFVRTLDTPLIQSWDVVVIDTGMAAMFVTFACVPQKWKVPFVLLSPNVVVHPADAPPWPFPILGVEYTDHLSFLQRGVLAILKPLLSLMFDKLTMLSLPFLQETGHGCNSSDIKRYTSPTTYFPNIIVSVTGFDFPRPHLPLTEYVGPILSKNREPLPNDLEQWLHNRLAKSVVYISMGSTGLMTDVLAESIVSGILATKYSAVWSLKESAQHVLDSLTIDKQRFYIAKWVPQLTVFKHGSVGMAILHAGLGGLQEALYNGHPVISLPSSGDQWSNAAKVQHYKLGLYLRPSEVNAETITEAIKTVNGEEYRSNVRKLQKIFLHAGGAERAADLVEFYEEVGYEHLVPAYAKYEWSWVQYYNVDVYALLLTCVLLIIFVVYKAGQCCCHKCCRRTKKSKVE